jgi:multidrug transporter EmrE-like cation transporter
MNDQNLLPAGIPWYRTRLFWGVVCATVSIGILIFYFSNFYRPGHAVDQMLIGVAYAFGSTFFSLVGFNALGKAGGIITTLLYIGVLSTLAYKTFARVRVELVYPILLFVIFALTFLFNLIFLSAPW